MKSTKNKNILSRIENLEIKTGGERKYGGHEMNFNLQHEEETAKNFPFSNIIIALILVFCRICNHLGYNVLRDEKEYFSRKRQEQMYRKDISTC